MGEMVHPQSRVARFLGGYGWGLLLSTRPLLFTHDLFMINWGYCMGNLIKFNP